jgi:5-methylthioadenosine/S-adenosylhomocysteine deaminase
MSLCINDVRIDGAPGAIRCAGGIITALGPDVVPEPGDDVVDGRGSSVIPGLVNGHGHAAMTLLRSYGDDMPLMEWLENRIWPAEARMTGDDVYWGARLACIEMIRTGTTHFWDMYWFADDVARAAVHSGLRATPSQVIVSMAGAPAAARADAAGRSLDRLAELGPLITPSLGPHSIYSVNEDDLRTLAALAAERLVPVQIHCSETEKEVADCLAEHGCRPAYYLDRVGLLGPATVLAHGVWLDADELALAAERGATVVTNPASNMKLAVGRAFPYPAARAAGVPVGLGTDGAASNNSLDLIAELKHLALLQKHAHSDPSVMPSGEAWMTATGAGAPVLGGTPLAAGQPADFSLVDAGATGLIPAALVDALVYSGTGAVVSTVVVAGKVVMRDRVVPGEDEVRERALDAAGRLRDSA